MLQVKVSQYSFQLCCKRKALNFDEFKLLGSDDFSVDTGTTRKKLLKKNVKFGNVVLHKHELDLDLTILWVKEFFPSSFYATDLQIFILVPKWASGTRRRMVNSRGPGVVVAGNIL